MSDDCIFCKIIKGDIPSAKIYEDDKVFAFLDIAPVNKGHVLIIPKNHAADFTEMSGEDINSVFTAAQKIGNALMKATDAGGFNMQMNVKPVAGQVVFHAHLHIVPRFEGDGLKLWPGGKYEDSEMDKLKEDIIQQL